MQQEIWKPNEYDKILACQGYVQYATSISILNDPVEYKQLHGQEVVNEDNRERIYLHAHDMMLNGLKSVIKYANPPELRSKLLKMEKVFEDALPNMIDTVNDSYKNHGDRLDKINPWLRILRPLPITEKIIYGYVCHSRVEKLPASILMGGFMMNEVFLPSEAEVQDN
jgi:hypothetical protein